MKVAVLTGGVGGAKLVLGLSRLLPPDQITAIVNTGDDFRHLGLAVSPDIDTLLYTLAGKANAAQGWGRESETMGFMTALRELGGEDWFLLGDHDLALHVLRTHRLNDGDTLSKITRDFASAWQIEMNILPMSDDRVATILETDQGQLDFQRYFVEQRCVPRVSRIWFDGAERATPAPGVVEAIEGADIVLIAPSNPYLSIDPLLAVQGLRDALTNTSAPIVAVSPIIGGRAVKGPTAKLMGELGIEVTNNAIAAHYGAFIDGLVIDRRDEAPNHVAVVKSDILMTDDSRKIDVARTAIMLAEEIGSLKK